MTKHAGLLVRDASRLITGVGDRLLPRHMGSPASDLVPTNTGISQALESRPNNQGAYCTSTKNKPAVGLFPTPTDIVLSVCRVSGPARQGLRQRR